MRPNRSGLARPARRMPPVPRPLMGMRTLTTIRARPGLRLRLGPLAASRRRRPRRPLRVNACLATVSGWRTRRVTLPASSGDVMS